MELKHKDQSNEKKCFMVLEFILPSVLHLDGYKDTSKKILQMLGCCGMIAKDLLADGC